MFINNWRYQNQIKKLVTEIVDLCNLHNLNIVENLINCINYSDSVHKIILKTTMVQNFIINELKQIQCSELYIKYNITLYKLENIILKFIKILTNKSCGDFRRYTFNNLKNNINQLLKNSSTLLLYSNSQQNVPQQIKNNFSQTINDFELSVEN